MASSNIFSLLGRDLQKIIERHSVRRTAVRTGDSTHCHMVAKFKKNALLYRNKYETEPRRVCLVWLIFCIFSCRFVAGDLHL